MEDGTAALACLVLSLRFNNQILLHRLLGFVFTYHYHTSVLNGCAWTVLVIKDTK